MEWLERTLIAGPYYCLCLTEKSFRKVLKQLEIDEEDSWIKNPHSHATLHWVTIDDKLTCILCMRDENKDIEVIHAMIAHEVMHIWQAFKEHIGEKFPNKEFEAYSIQVMCMRLFYAYKKQSKVKRKK